LTYESIYIKIYNTKKYRLFFYNIPITKGVKNMVNKEKNKPKPGKPKPSKPKPGKPKPPMRDPIMKRR
jgi:hypothetical protein